MPVTVYDPAWLLAVNAGAVATPVDTGDGAAVAEPLNLPLAPPPER